MADMAHVRRGKCRLKTKPNFIMALCVIQHIYYYYILLLLICYQACCILISYYYIHMNSCTAAVAIIIVAIPYLPFIIVSFFTLYPIVVHSWFAHNCHDKGSNYFFGFELPFKSSVIHLFFCYAIPGSIIWISFTEAKTTWSLQVIQRIPLRKNGKFSSTSLSLLLL